MILQVLFFWLSLTSSASAWSINPRHWFARRASRNVPPEGFFDPRSGGGQWLTIIPVTYPMGMGEPLNAVISGHSDPDVLEDREEKGGLKNYFLSLKFSGECLGQHLGTDQAANLGDGNGIKNETAVMRYNFGDPYIGSCKQSVQGGNHFRYWIQNGPNANTGAVFMAVSYEKSIDFGHDIVRDGYNFGRDLLIGNLTSSHVNTLLLTNTTSLAGRTSYGGYTYLTDVQYKSGMMSNSSDGINHWITVEQDGRPAIDGLLAILTVKIEARPANAATGLNVQSLWSPALAGGLSAFSLFFLLS